MLEGELAIGGQEHMYMETQSVVVVPHEDDELYILASTQGAMVLQVGLNVKEIFLEQTT